MAHHLDSLTHLSLTLTILIVAGIAGTSNRFQILQRIPISIAQSQSVNALA